MKSIVFLVTAMICGQVLARDYDQRYGQCHFSGTEQDAFNGERALPFNFNVSYIVSIDRSTGQKIAQRVLIQPQVNNTTQVSYDDISEVARKINFQVYHNAVSTDISFDEANLKTLFAYMGAYRVLQNDHYLPPIQGSYAAGQRYRVQTHLDPNHDFGLSYHLSWYCDFSATPRQPTDPSRPGQRPTPGQRPGKF